MFDDKAMQRARAQLADLPYLVRMTSLVPIVCRHVSRSRGVDCLLGDAVLFNIAQYEYAHVLPRKYVKNVWLNR